MGAYVLIFPDAIRNRDLSLQYKLSAALRRASDGNASLRPLMRCMFAAPTREACRGVLASTFNDD